MHEGVATRHGQLTTVVTFSLCVAGGFGAYALSEIIMRASSGLASSPNHNRSCSSCNSQTYKATFTELLPLLAAFPTGGSSATLSQGFARAVSQGLIDDATQGTQSTPYVLSLIQAAGQGAAIQQGFEQVS